MIKLADILLEIEAEPIITDLKNLDDEIKDALENAPKNEVLGTVSLVLAVPGIINAIMKKNMESWRLGSSMRRQLSLPRPARSRRKKPASQSSIRRVAAWGGRHHPRLTRPPPQK